MFKLISHHRGYYAFAAATLAIAVSVNLIVFTVVNALWLRPLPFADPDRLVVVTSHVYFSLDSPALKSFNMVAGQVITDEEMSGLTPQLTFAGITRPLETVGVTPEYFDLLGLSIRGRTFTADDNRLGAEPVAIISHRLWSREFGRAAARIGSTSGAKPFPFRVIGVAPPGFEGARRGEKVDVWIPSNLVARMVPGAGNGAQRVPLIVFARLHQGQDADEVARQLLSVAVSDRDRQGLVIAPLKDVFGTQASRTILISERNTLTVVAGLAGLGLLGGCATLMALVLVHYERRRRELALRVALGVTRTRLMAGLVSELAVIALAGGVGALLLAMWVLRSIPALSLPGGVDLGRLDLSVDWRVLAAAIVATLVTLLIAACLPLARFTRATLAGELLSGPAHTPSAASQRVRQFLLAFHVAATIVVMVVAGLFVRAIAHGFTNAPGFDVPRTLFATVQIRSPLGDRSATTSTLAERRAKVAAAIAAVPGLEGVALGTAPIGADAAATLLAPLAIEAGGTRREMTVGMLSGSPTLLTVLGVPLVAGRSLRFGDEGTNPASAVVTASLAGLLWPTRNPVGEIFTVTGRREGRYQVVGITRDFAFGSLSAPASGVIVTAREGSGIQPRFVLRSNDVEALMQPVRAAIDSALPEATSVTLETGAQAITRELARQRLGAWFFSGFGLAALVLGAGGVFGLVAYLAESRRREFGVRLALGATPTDLVMEGLFTALVPVVVGVTFGSIAAGLIARIFSSLLTGLSSLDPPTYIVAGATMLACSALAGVGAAWRLRTIMPSEALRSS